MGFCVATDPRPQLSTTHATFGFLQLPRPLREENTFIPEVLRGTASGLVAIIPSLGKIIEWR